MHKIAKLMYNMYDMIHDTIRSWGNELATNFSLASVQESVYGSWGVIPDIDVQPPYMTTAKKYQALLDNLPPAACRSTYQWTGRSSNLWSDVCNWDKTKLPQINSTVYIPNNSPYQPLVDVPTEIKMISLATNAMLTVLTGIQLTLNGE
ncbi:MAG: hypothetical protein IPG00_11450 [Saprospiraceae bacterium]|nr:hypothetical protein [Saprospiraceae bacterium]